MLWVELVDWQFDWREKLDFTSWAQVHQSVTHSHVQVERPWEMITGEELVPINSYFHIRNAIEGG